VENTYLQQWTLTHSRETQKGKIQKALEENAGIGEKNYGIFLIHSIYTKYMYLREYNDYVILAVNRTIN